MKAGEIVTKQNLVIGAKVTRGPDWNYDNQDLDCPYGITTTDGDADGIEWVNVEWIAGGIKVSSNNYRIGFYGEYDLQYYEDFQVKPSGPSLDEILNEMDILERIKRKHQEIINQKV